MEKRHNTGEDTRVRVSPEKAEKYKLTLPVAGISEERKKLSGEPAGFFRGARIKRK